MTSPRWPVGKIRVKSAHSVQKPGKDRLSDALIAGRKPARADSLRFSNRGSFSNQSTSIIVRDPREPKPRTEVMFRRYPILCVNIVGALSRSRGISKVSIDLGVQRTMTRLLYPKLAQRLTAADLHRIFGPTYKERQWAPTVARSPSSQVALLVQLRVFQAVGRFLPMKDVPPSGIEHVAQKLGVECETCVVYAQATLYRHQAAVLEYLGVTSWGDQARELAISTMIKVAKVRTDPADLINAAVDALVRHHFELPALIALRRLAGTVHSAVNAAQWREACAQLTAKQDCALEALLMVDSQTQESSFAELCRAPGRASRKNLKALIAGIGQSGANNVHARLDHE
jgi:hypothetical protein